MIGGDGVTEEELADDERADGVLAAVLAVPLIALGSASEVDLFNRDLSAIQAKAEEVGEGDGTIGSGG